jgi:hypothetical protein
VLAFAQPVEQYGLSVGELKRIVMRVQIVHIDLSEPRYLLSDLPAREKRTPILDNVLLEGDLRARKQAHCNGRFLHRGETARDGIIELRRDQLVSDLCRSGREQV